MLTFLFMCFIEFVRSLSATETLMDLMDLILLSTGKVPQVLVTLISAMVLRQLYAQPPTSHRLLAMFGEKPVQMLLDGVFLLVLRGT